MNVTEGQARSQFDNWLLSRPFLFKLLYRLGLIRKIKATPQEFAEAVLHLVRKSVVQFCNDLSVGFKMSEQNEITKEATEEALILHLWLTSKVLSVESDLLDVIHQTLIKQFRAKGVGECGIESFMKKIHERYKCYYEAWNDAEKGPQWIFATEALSHLFPDKVNQLDAFLGDGIILSAVFFMRALLLSRSRYKIVH